MRSLLVLMVLMLSVPAASSLAEQLDEPQQVIQQISDQMQEVLKREHERMASDPGYVYTLANEVLVPHIDFAKISSLVLGKYWRRASAEQQAAFSAQFQRLLVRSYSTAFNELGDWEMRYLPDRIGANSSDRKIRTQVLRAGAEPMEVLYRMHLKDGNWLAYDVTINGLSLVTTYSRSFKTKARRIGIEGLTKQIAQLNDRRIGRESDG